MSLFDEVFSKLKEQKKRKLSGKSNGIPFPFARWKEYIPDIEKGTYIGILGASGVGKSKLARNMTVYHPLDYSLKTGYPVKIIYFALEDSAKKILLNIIAHYLKIRHNYEVSITILESKGDFVLPDEVEKLIEKDAEFFRTIMKMLYIVEDCITPNEIEKKCEKVRESLKDEDVHVIVIVDNYANLVPDDGKKDWDAVRYFSRNVARIRLAKEFNWSVIAILQQDLDTEKYIFRSVAAGKSSAASIEPTAASIGDNKIVIRDFYYAIGIINPWKYEILRYPNSKGYDIDILRNKVRFLNIFKSNEEEVGGRLGLYFHRGEVFTELPHLSDENNLHSLYKDVLEIEKNKQLKFGQNKLF